METCTGDPHLLQTILNEALDLTEPEGGDNEAMADAFQELGSVVNQVTPHGDAGGAAGIVEVLNTEVAVDGQDPVGALVDLADDVLVSVREFQLDGRNLLDGVAPVVEACACAQKAVVGLE